MEEYFGPRNVAQRVQISETADKDDTNEHTITGMAGEKFTKVMRIQPHGFTSNPPKDSHGIMLAMGSKRDLAVVIGGESTKHKPKNIGEGNAEVYNADGSRMLLQGADIKIDAKGVATIKVKELVIDCDGVLVTVNGSGLSIKGGTVTHDGKNIGKTHGHVTAPPGPPGPPI